MGIPIGQTSRVGLAGEDCRVVVCEQCSTRYGYNIQVIGFGEGTSLLFLDNEGADQRARERAKHDLANKLATTIRVAPCPACGRIQQHMFDLARRSRGLWLGVLAFLLGAGGMVALIFSLGAYVNALKEHPTRWQWLLGSGIASLMLCVAAIAYRFLSNARFDPNSAPVEARIALGRKEGFILRVQDADEANGAVRKPDVEEGIRVERSDEV